MAILIDYIWQSTFCLLFFFGVYWVFLRNEKAFTLTRVYILVTPILAIVFPLLNIPVSFYKPDISLEQSQFFRALTLTEAPEEIVGYFGLPEVTVQSTKLPLLWEFQDYFILGYLIVIFLLATRLFWQYLQIRMLKEKGWYQAIYKLKEKCFLIPTYGLAPVFSFFNKLFWDETQALSPAEKDHIIQHEIEHIRQGHSWDVMYYQVLSILFWFNPAIHLMRSALVDVHEYLADANVLKQTENKAGYPRLVVKIAFKGMDLPIGNYFIRSTTLKRIMMMKKPGKINWFKTAMVLPLTAMLLGLVSMKTENRLVKLLTAETDSIESIFAQLKASRDSLEVGIKVKKMTNPVHYEFIGPLMGENLTVQLGELQYEFTNISSDEEYIKVRSLINSLRINSVITKNYDKAKTALEVDTRAEPDEGISNWTRYLMDNLKIPSKERELGLGSPLEVEFIVSPEGKISQPVIKRSFGGGLDEQLLQLIQSPEAPQWKPATVKGENVAMVTSTSLAFHYHNFAYNESRNFFPKAVDSGQFYDNDYSGDEIYDLVEQPPYPQGGMEGWNKYLKDNLLYTKTAKKFGIEGIVYVVFTVTKEGKLENPEILRGIGGGLDEEALRLVEAAPDWTPGMQSGRNVNVRMRLPIRFRIPEGNGSIIQTKQLGSVDQNKVFPSETFNKHLSKNLKYPLEARRDKVYGTVIVELSLDQKGKIKNSRIVNGLSNEINEDVLTVLKAAPDWKVDGSENEYLTYLPIRYKIFGLEDTSPPDHGLKHEIVVVAYSSSGAGSELKPPSNAVKKVGSYTSPVIGKPAVLLDENVKKDDPTASDPTYIDNISVSENVVANKPYTLNGAVKTTTKDLEPVKPEESGYQVDFKNNYQFKKDYPLIILDGKLVSMEELSMMDPHSIESIEVLKGEKAVEAGGTSEKGVLLIKKKE